MADKENYIIEECRFCGNKTKLDIVGSHSIDEEYEYYDDQYEDDITEWVSKRLGYC